MRVRPLPGPRPTRSNRPRPVLPLLAAVAAVTLGLLGPAVAAAADRPGPSAAVGAGSGPGVVREPTAAPYRNVVLLLADDMSTDVFRAVPRLAALTAQGVSFTRFAVTDSLCCPSRTSLLRGQYLHNHGITGNVGPAGGWPGFRDTGLATDHLGTWAQSVGIRTGYVGKYLNDYPGDSPPETVPAGWDRWVGPSGTAYRGYGYDLNVDGQVTRRGFQPTDYLTDVLTSEAVRFVEESSGPFLLVVAPFTPHTPATPAKRHRLLYAGSRAPRTPSYDVRDASWSPRWLSRKPPLTAAEKAAMDVLWRQMLRSSESIADQVQALQQALQRTGHDRDTLLVFMSDNGFHLGQHRLYAGKQTVYDEDVVVPLVLIGAGLPAGLAVPALASGVDLAPTVAAALGAPVPDYVDGRDLLPLVADPTRPWRTRVLVEHVGYTVPGDPDDPDGSVGVVPRPFASVRTGRWVYAEYSGPYDAGARQLFATGDTYQLANLARSAPAPVLSRLSRWLTALRDCAGPTCRVADGGPPGPAVQPDAGAPVTARR